jgi:hypothetical protein
MIFDEFKFTSEFKKKWSARQKEIEDKLKIPHSQVDLSDPFAWQQLLKEEWFMENGEKYPRKGLVQLGYRFYALFLPLVMVFSFLTATYYALTYQEYLSCWKVLCLMIPSFIFMIATIKIAYRIWSKRLNVKIIPIHRSDFPNDKSLSNND